ncbi:MAG TPA: hypothetical protein VHS74_06160 [Solirubrobacterales bacterium]|nr:hypothetical protein [Solirubrobacterales bacterium]
MSDHHLDGEIVAEEDADAEDAVSPVRPLPSPAPEAQSPVLRDEVRTAAVAVAGVAGGVLAGAATVAAVRVIGSAVGSRGNGTRLLSRRRRPGKVIASRSFLVDVHLLDR